MSPPAWHKQPDRKSARDAYAREQYDAAKESQRREEEARRKKEEEEKDK